MYPKGKFKRKPEMVHEIYDVFIEMFMTFSEVGAMSSPSFHLPAPGTGHDMHSHSLFVE